MLRLTLMLPVLCALATASESPDSPMKCSEATDCLECFMKNECVQNPDGTQICAPCGWCTAELDEWNADVKGACLKIYNATTDFCKAYKAKAVGFCPDKVCQPGSPGCVCTSNVCPVVNVFLHLLSLEGVGMLLFLIFICIVAMMSACTLMCCFRTPPRQIVLVRESHEDPGLLNQTEEDYQRL
eukprot:755090-Hanusia_phi.AAC.1